MKITRIDACRCLCGEGPVWDEAEQALYFLDIGRRLIHRYEPSTGALRHWTMPHGPGAMALRARGGAVVAMQDTVYALDLVIGALAPIVTAADQPQRAIFNDGKVDRRAVSSSDHARPTCMIRNRSAGSTAWSLMAA